MRTWTTARGALPAAALGAAVPVIPSGADDRVTGPASSSILPLALAAGLTTTVEGAAVVKLNVFELIDGVNTPWKFFAKSSALDTTRYWCPLCQETPEVL